jgi:hypothetical protein
MSTTANVTVAASAQQHDAVQKKARYEGDKRMIAIVERCERRLFIDTHLSENAVSRRNAVRERCAAARGACVCVFDVHNVAD